MWRQKWIEFCVLPGSCETFWETEVCPLRSTQAGMKNDCILQPLVGERHWPGLLLLFWLVFLLSEQSHCSAQLQGTETCCIHSQIVYVKGTPWVIRFTASTAAAKPVVTSSLECVLVLWMKLGLSLDKAFNSKGSDNPVLNPVPSVSGGINPNFIVISQVRVTCLIRVIHLVAGLKDLWPLCAETSLSILHF